MDILSEHIGPDKAFSSVVKEVFSWQKDNIQKEQIINNITDKIVKSSDNNGSFLKLQQAIQMFCDAEPKYYS